MCDTAYIDRLRYISDHICVTAAAGQIMYSNMVYAMFAVRL